MARELQTGKKAVDIFVKWANVRINEQAEERTNPTPQKNMSEEKKEKR